MAERNTVERGVQFRSASRRRNAWRPSCRKVASSGWLRRWRDPVPGRLRRRLELAGPVDRIAGLRGQINHLPPELRSVGWTCKRHRLTPFPLPNRVNPKPWRPTEGKQIRQPTRNACQPECRRNLPAQRTARIKHRSPPPEYIPYRTGDLNRTEDDAWGTNLASHGLSQTDVRMFAVPKTPTVCRRRIRAGSAGRYGRGHRVACATALV